MTRPNRPFALTLVLLAAAACALLLLYVCLGTETFAPWDLLPWHADDVTSLVLQFRWKRGLLALVVGAGLAVSGTAFQALLRNPLADPFIVGVSGGSAVGGTLVMVGMAAVAHLLPGMLQSTLVFAGAFLGAVLVALLLYRLSSVRGVLAPNSLLLMGVVFNFFASSVVLFLKAILHGTKLQEVLFWLMGTLAVETLPWWLLGLAAAVSFLAFVPLVRQAAAVNLLAIGDEYAFGTGVSPERVRRVLFLLGSLLVAVAVSMAGFIGFIGLIVPHLVRLAVGADHRNLFPLTALAGGIFLLLSDLVARLSYPLVGTQLPVGVLTSLIGGPLFIALLARSQRREERP